MQLIPPVAMLQHGRLRVTLRGRIAVLNDLPGSCSVLRVRVSERCRGSRKGQENGEEPSLKGPQRMEGLLMLVNHRRLLSRRENFRAVYSACVFSSLTPFLAPNWTASLGTAAFRCPNVSISVGLPARTSLTQLRSTSTATDR